MAVVYDDYDINRFSISDTAFYKGQLDNNNVGPFIERLILSYIKNISFELPIIILYTQRTSKNSDNIFSPYIYIHNYRPNHRKIIIDRILRKYTIDRKNYLTRELGRYFNNKLPLDIIMLSDENDKAYRRMLNTRFIQTTDLFDDFATIITELNTRRVRNTNAIKYNNKISSVSFKKASFTEEELGNAPRELLNFVFLYWKTTERNKMKYQDYLCGLCNKEYGMKYLKIPRADYTGFVYKVKKNSVRADFNRNFMGMSRNEQITLLNSFYNRNNKENSKGWLKSAQLTAREVINRKVFSSGSVYKYYSEDSDEYRSIYDAFLVKYKASNYLDDYLKTLNINKFFISDVIAVKKGSDCINKLKTKISQITGMKDEEFIEVVSMMDDYFRKGELIPISLKMFLTFTKDPAYKEEVENISSRVKIINPPKDYYNGPYDLDDLDYFVLKLIKDIQKTNNRVTLTQMMDADDRISIDYNSFVYNTDVITRTYGGGSWPNNYSLRFTFQVNIKGKKKKYSFEIAKGSVKIRTVGTASATGEGSVNTSSLNYVMREVYSGTYRPQLRKLANARVAAFDRHLIRLKLTSSVINSSAEMKDIYKSFRGMMGEEKIINSGSYDEHRKTFDKFSIIYSTDSDEMKNLKLACMNAYVSYLRSISRSVGRGVTGLPPENFVELEKRNINSQISSLPIRTNNAEKIKSQREYEYGKAKTEKDKKKINLKYTNATGILSKNNLDIICAYELGMLFNDSTLNYVIKVDGSSNSVSMTMNLTEADKKKLILTEWGLISARGVLIFDDKRFENAQKIEDVLKNKIKMPALLKIGV